MDSVTVLQETMAEGSLKSCDGRVFLKEGKEVLPEGGRDVSFKATCIYFKVVVYRKPGK